MDIKRGLAVRSKAGRDKDRFFAVIAVEGNAARIADGELRKLSKPKLKKLMHLSATTTVFSEKELSSDKELNAAIKARFSGSTVNREG